MTELKAAKIAALVERLRFEASRLSGEFETSPEWLKIPYRFPDEPTVKTVTSALISAIDWHAECEQRCAYGTYPMIVDTCIWISISQLTTNQIHELCVLLNRLYHEALGKWG